MGGPEGVKKPPPEPPKKSDPEWGRRGGCPLWGSLCTIAETLHNRGAVHLVVMGLAIGPAHRDQPSYKHCKQCIVHMDLKVGGIDT